MLKNPLILIDTETGGLDDKKHSLLTVALLVVKNMQIVDRAEWKIKHDNYSVTAGALAVNKIDLVEFDKSATDKEVVGEEILRFLREHCDKDSKGMLFGQNTIFDKNFVESFLGSLNNKDLLKEFRSIISHRYIDLMSISAFLNLAGVLDTEGLGLDKIMSSLGIEAHNRHDAMGDAEVTFEALEKMISMIK